MIFNWSKFFKIQFVWYKIKFYAVLPSFCKRDTCDVAVRSSVTTAHSEISNNAAFGSDETNEEGSLRYC